MVPSVTVLLVVLLALGPGIHAWWSGRTLLARVEDPAFPELVFARSQRRVQVIVFAAVFATFVSGPHWLWAFPCFVVATLVGGFPFRRTLFGETWGVVDYVFYTLASVIGTAGFWLSIAFAPAIVLALAHGWVPAAPVQGAIAIGAALATVLFAWELTYPLVWLRLTRASPLDRPDLQPRFDDVVRRSGIAQRSPRLFRFGARGAYVMNAFALPSMRQPRVAFGDTLLELLTPDEIVAVFAHEMSHLEHYNRRRMLRFRLVTYLLVLGGTALPALVLASAPALDWAVKLTWPIVVLALAALRLSKSQEHETESDLRAAALTGDPDSMVRALTKLHHYSRMPRRWPHDFERASTHPSLARRIQALRAQTRTATADATGDRLDTPTILRSTEPGAFVALDDKRAYWFEGVPAEPAADSLSALRELATRYHAVAYADLAELRVAVVRGGGRALVARDRTGKTWSMPLQSGDVAQAQRALDVLDVRLGSHMQQEDRPTKARAAAALLALVLLVALDFGWPWVPLLVTLARPSAAAVAAMGTMAVARVVVGALAGTLGMNALGSGWATAWAAAAVIFAIGVWSCRFAWRWARGDERPAGRSFALVTLSMLALVFVGALAITHTYGSATVPTLSLQSHGALAGVALLLLGAGAAFVTYRDSLRRRSGIVLGLAALALAAAAVRGERFTGGASGPPVPWRTGHADVLGRFELESPAYRLHLSPAGRRFAIQSVGRRFARYDDDGGLPAPARYTIATLAGARRTVDALDLAFLDDDHVLVLRASADTGDSLELALEPAEGAQDGEPAASWRRTIPAFYAPTLSIDRAARRWRVVGHDVEAHTIVASAGPIGGDSIAMTRESAGTAGGRPVHVYRDGASLVANLAGSIGKPQMALAMLGFYPFRWEVWRVARGRREKIGSLPGMPECGGSAGADGMVLCVARGRSGITVWRFAPPEPVEPTPLGSLPAGLDVVKIGMEGRIAAGARDGSALAVLDAASGRATRIEIGAGVQLQGSSSSPTSFTTDVGVAAGMAATLVVRDGKSEVTFYRVP